jgi:hypothetical protein
MSDEGFISRWSRRKTEAKTQPKETPPARPDPEEAPVAPAAGATPAQAPPLPPVESLTTESDFTPFMKPGVDAGTRREAVKVLLRDPRFNVMDGLDVYIDDYSKPDPLPEGWLEKMTQTARLGEYRDPDVPAAEPDAENAEKTAREGAEIDAARAEDQARELAATPSDPVAESDTPDAAMVAGKVKELPPPG